MLTSLLCQGTFLFQSQKTRSTCGLTFTGHLWVAVRTWVGLGMGRMTQTCGIQIEFRIGRTCVWFFLFIFFPHKGNIAPEQACTCDSLLCDTQSRIQPCPIECTSTTNIFESDNILNKCVYLIDLMSWGYQGELFSCSHDGSRFVSSNF